MSDTPRTDAIIDAQSNEVYELHKLCRQLERDLASSKADADNQALLREKLERENAELRAALKNVYHSWALHGIAPELEKTIERLLYDPAALKKAKP